jgi:ferredoxin-NADP reductase
MTDALPVAGLRRFGESVFELQLARRDLAFVPGDCMALYAADGRVSRPYSIASGAGEEILRFLIRRMPGGAVSEYLATRAAGDEVRVSPPFGWFRPGEHAGARPFACVATGTGIAPFLALFRTRDIAPKPVVLWGVREADDLADADWLRARCDLHLAVSREDVPGRYRGRVTGLLGELPEGPDADFYLCGLDAMIDELTTRLMDRGVPLARIHRECFFNASF